MLYALHFACINCLPCYTSMFTVYFDDTSVLPYDTLKIHRESSLVKVFLARSSAWNLSYSARIKADFYLLSIIHATILLQFCLFLILKAFSLVVMLKIISFRIASIHIT